jgi:hypothetical protein
MMLVKNKDFATGFWLLAFGYPLLAAGYPLLATSQLTNLQLKTKSG